MRNAFRTPEMDFLIDEDAIGKYGGDEISSRIKAFKLVITNHLVVFRGYFPIQTRCGVNI